MRNHHIAPIAVVAGLVLLGWTVTALAQEVPPYPGERVKGKEAFIKVAAAQFEPHIGDKARNLAKMLELVDRAADQGVKLVVLPELANSGYIFNSKEEALALSEPVPGGETTNKLIAKAKEQNIYIVFGIDERGDGYRLYNSAALVGPEGYIGKYRKLHLWDEEKIFFEPGDLGLPVFDLPFGRLGMMICYDGWFVETSRILRLQGADIIANPTNWIYVPGVITPEKPLAPNLHDSLAHANKVFIVSADRIGTERNQPFLGLSNIAGPRGGLARASFDREEIITAEINLIDARYTIFTRLADGLRDRRVDVYAPLLGYQAMPDPGAMPGAGAYLVPK